MSTVTQYGTESSVIFVQTTLFSLGKMPGNITKSDLRSDLRPRSDNVKVVLRHQFTRGSDGCTGTLGVCQASLKPVTPS